MKWLIVSFDIVPKQVVSPPPLRKNGSKLLSDPQKAHKSHFQVNTNLLLENVFDSKKRTLWMCMDFPEKSSFDSENFYRRKITKNSKLLKNTFCKCYKRFECLNMPKQVSDTTFWGREYRKSRDFPLSGQGGLPCQGGSKKFIRGNFSCKTVVTCSGDGIKLLEAV